MSKKSKQSTLNNGEPLDFLDTSSPSVTEDEILLYLARILGDMYLKQVYPEHQEEVPPETE